MPESVAAVAGATVEAPGFESLAAPGSAPRATNELDKDAFLQLLVAQLKYQDPLEPQSSDEFIATSAQFTVVEKLDELTKQGENTALINSLTTAGSLIGREVTTSGPDGDVTATVRRSEIVSGTVQLVTDRGSVALNEIIAVGGTAPETTSTPTVTSDSNNQNTAAASANQNTQGRGNS